LGIEAIFSGVLSISLKTRDVFVGNTMPPIAPL